MVDENLTVPLPVRIAFAVGKCHLMVDRGDMLGRDTDFNDLDVRRRVTDPVTDARWLRNAVTSCQTQHVTLIFVKNINPALVTKNQLKPDGVIVNLVGHGTTVRDTDVTGNDGTAKP